MALERSQGNSSELKNLDRPEMHSKAHVPKLLLTQTLQFQKDSSRKQKAMEQNMASMEATADNQSVLLPSSNQKRDMFISQENPIMKAQFDTTRRQQELD